MGVEPRHGPRALRRDLGACQELRPPEEATKHDIMAHQNALQTGRIRKARKSAPWLSYGDSPVKAFFHGRSSRPDVSGAIKGYAGGLDRWAFRTARPGDMSGRGLGKERAKGAFPGGLPVPHADSVTQSPVASSPPCAIPGVGLPGRGAVWLSGHGRLRLGQLGILL
jgi:hypothetical protein